MSNLATTCQKIDGGDGGTAKNHLFSQSHLDLSQNIFDYHHDNLKYTYTFFS